MVYHPAGDLVFEKTVGTGAEVTYFNASKPFGFFLLEFGTGVSTRTFSCCVLLLPK